MTSHNREIMSIIVYHMCKPHLHQRFKMFRKLYNLMLFSEFKSVWKRVQLPCTTPFLWENEFTYFCWKCWKCLSLMHRILVSFYLYIQIQIYNYHDRYSILRSKSILYLYLLQIAHMIRTFSPTVGIEEFGSRLTEYRHVLILAFTDSTIWSLIMEFSMLYIHFYMLILYIIQEQKWNHQGTLVNISFRIILIQVGLRDVIVMHTFVIKRQLFKRDLFASSVEFWLWLFSVKMMASPCGFLSLTILHAFISWVSVPI